MCWKNYGYIWLILPLVTEEVYMDSSDTDYYQGGPGPVPNLMDMPHYQGGGGGGGGPMGPPGPNNFGKFQLT